VRILLVTGKGGVGKTTVAAATALRLADQGLKTLVTSTDPAHSLADAFAVKLRDEPTEIVPNLIGQQIDSQEQLARHWGEIQDQLKRVFEWGGVRGVAAEEFLVFPGMDELFALLEVKDQAKTLQYDAIVVDCAPTAETLRLLSLPEVLSWYFERVFPTERRIMKAARPVLSTLTNLPMPSDDVFSAAEGVFEGVEEVKALLSDQLVTSARLVVNPEKMVINEARRTYTYLSLFGYSVDGVVVNRVLPDSVTDPYFAGWRDVQARHLETIDSAFEEVPIVPLRLFDQEMVGIDALRILGNELYVDLHPLDDFEGRSPFELLEDGESVVLKLSMPFVESGDVDVLRHGDELFITVGAYRRSFVLPDSLRQKSVASAKLSEGALSVRFDPSVAAATS